MVCVWNPVSRGKGRRCFTLSKGGHVPNLKKGLKLSNMTKIKEFCQFMADCTTLLIYKKPLVFGDRKPGNGAVLDARWDLIPIRLHRAQGLRLKRG